MSLAKIVGGLLRDVHAGAESLAERHPALAGAPVSMTLASDWFAEGGLIPIQAAGPGVGDNVSPPLAWSAAPAGTRELALLVEDPDAPLPRPFVHLIAYGLSPQLAGLRAGALCASPAPARFGLTSFGRPGYAGPRGLPGHGLHDYRFQVLALDRPTTLAAPPKLKAFLAAIDGAVLARGTLRGRFGR